MKNGAGSGDAPQQPKRSLQWITALLLLALPAAFLIFGGRLLATEASTTAPGGPAGSPPAAAPAGVEPAPGNRTGQNRTGAAGIDVPDYVPAAPMPVVDGQTVVSVAFDDGFAGQRRAAQIMTDAGLDGTFYVNSGYLDKPGYLTLKQVRDIALKGHEIGGHSLSHPDLQDLSVDEAARQICMDRRNLVNWGFSVTNFSYPFASHNQQVEAQAKECGYNSARSLGDVRTRFGCEECPQAESLPPETPYRLQAPAQVESDWTLRDLQNTVTAAETSGGWVILTFHGLCPDECTEIGVSEDIFTQFTDWLAERNARGRTVVRTVQQVIGGPKGEPADWPAAEPAATGSNGVKNPGLERRADGGPPVCWMEGGYGRNTARFSEAAGRDGFAASKLTVQEYVDGDAKLLPQQDLGECAPQVIPGRSYSLRVRYQSDALTQFSVYYRDGTGSWRYWTASPYFSASQEEFAQAEWTTPPVPEDANALSFGLALLGNGELITDDYALYDAAGAPPLKAK